MKNILLGLIIFTSIIFLMPNTGEAKWDWLKEKASTLANENLNSVKSMSLSDTKIGEGLKEALKVGTKRTIEATSKENGFLNNDKIKITMPEKLKTLEKGLRMVGFGPKVDEFVLSMNRAAEQSAPYAQEIFFDAILNMTIDDVQKIYSSGDTAATEFFKQTTYEKLTEAFRPTVDKALQEFNVTSQYKQLIDKYQTIPFAKNLPAPDADQYVISKALDGLFLVLGEEEKKIRTDPSARATQILKDVFK